MVMVVRIKKTLQHLNNIYILVPANADKEVGFYNWIYSIINISKKTHGKITFLANGITLEILKQRLKEFKIFNSSNYIVFEYYPNIAALPFQTTEFDLTIAIASRPSTISYNRRQLILPKIISHQPENLNYIVIYPEQVEKPIGTITEINDNSLMEFSIT
jgi:hypothetical protein